MVHIAGEKGIRFDKMNQWQRDQLLFGMIQEEKRRVAKLNRAQNILLHLVGALVQTLEVQRLALQSRLGDAEGSGVAGTSVEVDVIRRATELADEAREVLGLQRFITDEKTGAEWPMPAEQVLAERIRESLSIRLLSSVRDEEPQSPEPGENTEDKAEGPDAGQ